MNIGYLIPFVIVIGLATLFLFPEPESNFLAYIGTAALFVAVIAALIVYGRK